VNDLAVAAALTHGILVAVLLLLAERREVRLRSLECAGIVSIASFAILPIYLHTAELDALLALGDWNWIFRLPLESFDYALSPILASLGFTFLWLGYHASRWLPAPQIVITTKQTVAFAVLLAIGGSLCLAVYAASLGGLVFILENAAALRRTDPIAVTPFAFLKHVIQVLLIAAMLFWGVLQTERARSYRTMLACAFGVTLVLSLIVLFHRASRLDLLTFIAVFPLAQWVRHRRIPRWALFGGLSLSLLIIVFGKPIFGSGVDDRAIERRMEAVDGTSAVMAHVAVEFIFPYATLSNALSTVPDYRPYRYFSDVLVAVANFLPGRLLRIADGESASAENSRYFRSIGTVPVDIYSFGFVNFGAVGTALASFLFGAFLRTVDRILSPVKQPVLAPVYTASAIFLGQRVAYADPAFMLTQSVHFVALLALAACTAVLIRAQKSTPSTIGGLQ